MATDGHLNFDTKIDESGFNTGISKLMGLATKGFTAITAAGAAAFGAITVASLKSVASLEQNVGGVETLFKKSADTVIENANRAYKTAGMSANEYMSTVTGFSASLLQSLGNDTKKAAAYADRAIVDMSDNANKMGTDMELIQNAYQGFAKQNYTMLDNLKLGYGGTKTEMERLIKDASKMKDVQKELGVTVDESSMSFGNIVNAISVMQKSMGIAGTTSKEAATTIEGSVNSMKAAWDNFLNGSGTAEEFADAFGVAADNIIKNLGEIVPRLITTIPTVVESIYDHIAEQLEKNGPDFADQAGAVIENMVAGVEQNAPKMATAAAEMIESLGNGLAESAPEITNQAGRIIENLITGIQKYAPRMLAVAVLLLASFADGIGEQLPQLIPQALQMVVTLADAVISNIPTIVNAGIAILKGLGQGIVNSLPILISEGPRIINDFANAIYSGLGQLILAGLNIIKSLAKGIWNNKGLILKNAGAILLAIINVFSLSKMVSLGKNLIKSLGSGIKGAVSSAVNALKSVGERMVNAFKNGIKWSNAGTFTVTALKNGIHAAKTALVRALKAIGQNAMEAFKNLNWRSIGSNIISGIVNGIKAAAGKLLSAMGDLAKNALKAAKKKLGIHSPSRVFRDQVGKMMALGVGVGFEKNIPIESMSTGLQRAVNSLKKDVVLTTSARQGKTIGGIKNNPEFYPENPGTDWDEWERRQRKLNKERDSRPIFLGTERIDKPLPKGAVPAW